jgi:PAS domain S-box-containing protein
MLQLVLNIIPVCVFWKDRNSVFLGCNEPFAADAGYTSTEDIVGKTDYDMPWKDQADLYRADDLTIMETGIARFTYEEPQTTPDGHIIWLKTSKAPMRDENGQIIGIIGAYEDITERRRAEQALCASEEKYRELVQTANSIIIRWGRDGRIHFFNEFAQAFFGYTEKEIVGRNVMDTIVPEAETSGRDLRAMIAEILEHPESHETNVNENIRKNGERVWIAWTNKLVLDEHGNVTEILSVGVDVTTSVRADEEKRRFYRKTIEAATDGKLVICDRDEIEQIAGPQIAECEIMRAEDVKTVRQIVTEVAQEEGMDDSRIYDLILCVGEATTNVIKHAPGGKASIHRTVGALLVMVTDQGPGIQAINLPDVALRRGYTTAVSLGMGYKAMISAADRVYLATGSDAGTTVAIEMKIHPVPKSLAELTLPDTW